MEDKTIEDLEVLKETVASLGLAKAQKHILLCCDQTKPKCCTKEISLEAWEYLKNRLKELELDQVLRTKANCVRVCAKGPIMIVYPDGVWYHSVTPEVIEKVIQKHIIGNSLVTEYAFHIQPLNYERKQSETE